MVAQMMRLLAWSAGAALVAAPGCVLFFDDQAGGGGVGGAGESGGGASGAPCRPLEDLTLTSDTSWLLSAAHGQVLDLVEGPNGRTYFTGVAEPGYPGSILQGSQPQTGSANYFVAHVEQDGSGVVACDLGPATALEIRLSHGDPESVHVAWAHEGLLCVAPADDPGTPSAQACPSRAVVECSMTGSLLEPTVAVAANNGIYVGFRPVQTGSVSCRHAGSTFTKDLADATGHVLETTTGDWLELGSGLSGDDVRSIRMTATGNGVRITGHCYAGHYTPMHKCDLTAGSAFLPFVTDISPGLNLTFPPLPSWIYPDGSPGVYPSALGIAGTTTNTIFWRADGDQGDSIGPLNAPVQFFSVESVQSTSYLLGAGSAETAIGMAIACPAGSCGEFAFWARLNPNNTGLSGRGYGVVGNDCKQARAVGAYITGPDVVFGGAYRCGRLRVGNLDAVDSSDDFAIFVARVPE
jgi:hypothetical protein